MARGAQETPAWKPAEVLLVERKSNRRRGGQIEGGGRHLAGGCRVNVDQRVRGGGRLRARVVMLMDSSINRDL